MNGQPETLDDSREYIKQLKRDLAAANKRLEEVTKALTPVVLRLMNPLAAIDGKEGES